MKEIGAFEAKSKLGQLLDWVEAGEEIITRRGKAVARMISADAIFDRERRPWRRRPHPRPPAA